MKFVGHDLDQALAAEAAGAASLAAAYGKRPARRDSHSPSFLTVLRAYKVAPDGFERLAASTQKHWRRSLDVIEREFGSLPLKALSAPRMKKVIIAWRNSFKATPRQADYHMTVLKRALSWAKENGEIDVNPAEGIAGIYKSNRADLVVEANELAAILDKVTLHAARAIRFAAATGIRREDLTKLRWAHVHFDDGFIKFATGKSAGRKTVVVPILPEARGVVEDAKADRERMIAGGRVPSAYLLVTHLGTPWRPDSITQAFGDAARELGIDRHLNDLRGTAITRFAIAGWSDEHIADVVGWEVARVRNIRKHYVDPSRVVLGLVAQLENAEKTG